MSDSETRVAWPKKTRLHRYERSAAKDERKALYRAERQRLDRHVVEMMRQERAGVADYGLTAGKAPRHAPVWDRRIDQEDLDVLDEETAAMLLRLEDDAGKMSHREHDERLADRRPHGEWPQWRQKLLTDFELFCNNIGIVDKKGRPCLFYWNKSQRKMAVKLLVKFARGLPMMVVVAKARQWGCSLLVTFLIAWLMLRKRGLKAMVVVHEARYVSTFRDRYRNIFEYLPKCLLARVVIDNDNRMQLDNGSLIDFYCAGTKATAAKVGRSETYQAQHLSEVPFWYAPEQTMVACRQSLELGGAGSLSCMESSPKGSAGVFPDTYMSAKKGDNEFIPFFVPWHAIEWYQMPLSVEQMRLWDEWRSDSNSTEARERARKRLGVIEDKKARIERFRLQPEQYLWWCWTLRNKLSGDESEMMREFPDDDVSCFASSGTHYYDREIIEKVRVLWEARKDDWKTATVTIDPVTDRPMVVPDGKEFWLLEAPEKDEGYTAILDPAEGGSQSADWSVMWIVRRTVEAIYLCARVVGKQHADVFCDRCWPVLLWYGQPLLCIEANKGAADILEYRRREYPNLMRRQRFGIVDGDPLADAFGFWMAPTNRDAVLASLATGLRNGWAVLPSEDLAAQMATFIRQETSSGNIKASAQKGCNDDEVIVAALACYLHLTLPVDESAIRAGTDRTIVVAEPPKIVDVELERLVAEQSKDSLRTQQYWRWDDVGDA